MTTIAYKDGVVAVDTMSTCGGWIDSHNVRKLHRLPDGSIAACTGAFAKGMQLIDWIKNGEQGGQPDIGASSSVVRFFRDRQRVYEFGHYFELNESLIAFGSGSPVAKGVMLSGATPEQAVRIVMEIDPNTGGDVVSETVAQD